MAGRLLLLPVSLGGAEWSIWLPSAAHELACQTRYFVAENAKTARAELKAMNHPTPMRELAIEEIPRPLNAAAIDRLLQPVIAGHDLALVSEAGCPAVADPGALLVRQAHRLGITVKPLVGPSSILLALMASGMDGQRFSFHGYLPAKEPERGTRLRELERESARHQQTQLFIETPYRNAALYAAALEHCQPGSLFCVASNLSLPDESIITLPIAGWRKRQAPQIERRPTIFALLA